MKVLLLGAGASKPAGYPLANELMTAIERDARQSGSDTLKEAWKLWEETRRKAPGALRLLLEDPNPEVSLSVLDLCSISRCESFPEAFRDECHDNVTSASLSGGRIPSDCFISRDHEWLYSASMARRCLLDSLIAYFDWKHSQDSNAFRSRDYLRSVLGSLQTGDVVITLNWDTVAERTLFELGRWSPCDGYGFDKELGAGTPNIDPRLLPSELSKPSNIVVLKLHGSLGWYDRGDAQPYFDSGFLRSFNFVPADQDVIQDPRQPDHGSVDTALISYPSFLKKLDAPVMQAIWERADRALHDATEFEVWGYSLPSSDSAIRVLLNSFRSRMSQRGANCFIHIPDPQRDLCETDFRYKDRCLVSASTRARWKHFLGNRANIDNRALGL